MNIRKFNRKHNKGLVSSSKALRLLYCTGDRELIKPDHYTIKALIDKGYALLTESMLSITRKGKLYIEKHYPHLEEYTPEEVK